MFGGVLHVRPSYVYRSKIFFSDDNDRPELQTTRIVPDTIIDEFQNGFGLTNLHVGYAPSHGRWEVEGFVSNLADVAYRKGAGSAGESIGLPTQVRGEPRFYGLRISLRH